jgi:Holliday junction resolvasome RuvABC ATP-dependent DNA helicase subunit
MAQPVGGSDDILAAAVGEFIDRLLPIVMLLPEGRDADRDAVQLQLLREARRLSAAFLCCDGRMSDRELLAFRRSFGAVEPEVAMGPLYEMRKSDIVRRDQVFISTPAPLFSRLIEVDRTDGTANAWTYYEAALGIAHAVVALNDEPVRDSLVALDTYRTMLLDALKQKDVAPATEARLDSLIDELDGLVGLAAVKEEVKLIVNLTRVEKLRRDSGLPVPDRSRHLVFAGNPGTGKTTVARLLSRIYGALGVLAKGHLVETDRGGLVSGYVGQTAGKVTEVVTSALDGTLFIDEAYALATDSKEDFGAEAVATLLKLMEDNRARLIVVAAGYTEKMHGFVDSNPGLQSRFTKTIEFPDYSADELVQIFKTLGDEQEYHADDEVLARLRTCLAAHERGPAFGNARVVRNLFEGAIARQATRLAGIAAPTREQLTTLEPADIPEIGAAS